MCCFSYLCGMKVSSLMTEKKLLPNIVIIRIFLIFLLIIYHSFIVYGERYWAEPRGFKPIITYWWISKFSYSFLLELFVFISGYLFAYQIIELKRWFTYKGLLLSKFKRLIIPSIIYSFFYLLFILEEPFSAKFIYKLINGEGHMWFLPMLFWCFLFGYFVIDLKFDNRLKCFLLFCLAIYSFSIPDYFRVPKAFYYLFFFYLGFLGYRIQDIKISLLQVCIGIIVFLFVFVFLTLLKEFIVSNWDVSNIFVHKMRTGCLRLCTMIPATFGCVLVFSFITSWTSKWKKIPMFLSSMSSLCFGVYLYQQFILQVLYYRTELPVLAGPIWLPVLGFLITLVLSILLSKLTMVTKVGRLLIG